MTLLLGFGKKRKSTKKPPTKLLKLCKKLKIKVTIKRGNKRVYKKTTLLEKLCKKRSNKSTKSTKKSKFGNTTNTTTAETINKLFQPRYLSHEDLEKLTKLARKIKIKLATKPGDTSVYKVVPLLKSLCNTRDKQKKNNKKVSQFGFFWPFTNSMTREERRRAREIEEGTRRKIRANTPRFGGFPWPFKSDKKFLEELHAKIIENNEIRKIRKHRDKRPKEENRMIYPGEVY